MDRCLLNDRRQAAEILRISLRKLDYLISEKEIVGVIHIGRRVLIPQKSLEDFVRRNAQRVATISDVV